MNQYINSMRIKLLQQVKSLPSSTKRCPFLKQMNLDRQGFFVRHVLKQFRMLCPYLKYKEALELENNNKIEKECKRSNRMNKCPGRCPVLN